MAGALGSGWAELAEAAPEEEEPLPDGWAGVLAGVEEDAASSPDGWAELAAAAEQNNEDIGGASPAG